MDERVEANAGSPSLRRRSNPVNYTEIEDEESNEQVQHSDDGYEVDKDNEGSDWGDETSPLSKKHRSKRKRVLVDVHNISNAVKSPYEIENEYERERLERIRRNQEKMQQLGLQQMATSLVTTAAAASGPSGTLAPKAPRASRPPKERAPRGTTLPSRQSSRVRGQTDGSGAPAQLPNKEPEEKFMDLPAYFASINKDISGAIHTDGTFKGWVNQALIEKHGLGSNAQEAWEKEGGGQFSFKINKKAIPATLKAKGWSDARAFAAACFKKNPNAYFYRHVEPDEQQATGEWTQEEHDLFLATAREHGVGDKWGLFASYIPQRVGYQCSAYYREVILPSGLVIDPRWKMTKSGKAVFTG